MGAQKTTRREEKGETRVFFEEKAGDRAFGV